MIRFTLVQLLPQLFYLDLKLLSVTFVVLHQFPNLILVKVFYFDKTILLLFGPLQLVLKQFNLS